jgi:hypothetical protein
VLGVQDHVGVLGVAAGRVGELAEPSLFRPVLDHEPSSHAQVRHQGLASVQRRDQVLGAPFQPLDPGPGEAMDELRRQRKAQVRPALLDPDQARALQMRLQATPYGLDLGKFRHGVQIGYGGANWQGYMNLACRPLGRRRGLAPAALPCAHN